MIKIDVTLALLSVSLALAKNTRIADAKECVAIEQAQADLSADDITITKLTGTALDVFNAKVRAKYGLTPPPEQTGLLLLSKEGLKVIVVMYFEKGCMVSYKAMPKAFFDTLDERDPSKDDGSI